MSLSRLEIAGIRNIRHASLTLNPGLNLIFGQNGSGKTSILESIYFLGSARTFRNSSTRPLITIGLEECVVRGTLVSGEGEHQVGVQRNRSGSREIRIDSDDVRRASDLASLLPILVLGSDTVDLLLGPPGLRRRFLNWGLFHVEPTFSQVWEEANRCLKQRNEVLRTGGSDGELETWTRELVRYAERLDESRTRYMQSYEGIFQEHCEQLTDLSGITCQYYRGWGSDGTLMNFFEKDGAIDRKKGYTQRGFQRADVRIRVDGEEAINVCSRGELKVISWAMAMSQGALYSRGADKSLVYLVDDMAAELDDRHRRRICDHLVSTGRQIVATGIEQDSLVASWRTGEQKLFHVEHGKVRPVGEDE